MTEISRPRAPPLSVVIPVHNESACIGTLIGEIERALPDADRREIIVVDDASTDATPEALARLQKDLPGRLRVLRHDRQYGQSAALRTGVTAARHDLIVTLDGDGQNDPADIPRLLAVYAASPTGAVMVCGQRLRRQDSWLKRFASRVANGIRSGLLGDGVPDTGCGLKLFPRELFLRLPWFDHMHRFLPALVLRDGGRVEKVAVNHRPRAAGRTKYGIHNRLWVGVVDLLGVLWLQRRGRVTHNKEME
ncbi:MAG TPA: glycosyltransferase family 2 protein [Gammaproteobacteria bacterium]|nr:glycosyltransferase family 2 protein [Gammaproteobacteria bacterium]